MNSLAPRRAGRNDRMGRMHRYIGTLGLMAVLALYGCDEDALLGPPDPALAPLVGQWNGTTFHVAPQAAPGAGFDVIAQGGTFVLEIEPSGRYAAILESGGVVNGELGVITVDGNKMTQTPTSPPSDPSEVEWGMEGENHLTLDGEGEFDFNFDGVPDPAIVHIELDRISQS